MAIINCPNKSLPEFQALIAAYGEGRATAAWRNNNEVIPTVEQAAELLGIASPNTVNATLKVVEALGTDKVQKLYDKFYKSNPDKFYSELIPLAGKQQVEILKDYNARNQPKSLTDMLAGIMADMSYTVEVTTAYDKKGLKEQAFLYGVNNGYDYGSPYKDFELNGDKYTSGLELEFDGEEYQRYRKNGKRITREEFQEAGKIHRESLSETPTQYYSNLTVPGGTNYTENEIATPGITPSIKGHAQFSTDNGIGWFRSDDKSSTVPDDISKMSNEEIKKLAEEAQLSINELLVAKNYRPNAQASKIRRILEVQSDLFQKGRDREELVKPYNSLYDVLNRTKISENGKTYRIDTPSAIHASTGPEAKFQIYNETDRKFESKEKLPTDIIQWANSIREKLNTGGKDIESNQFLQLLNKDGNWIPFFIKSIVQDSAKKGYEKVLFPTGDTASKIEGHATLEQFKKQKEERVKVLELQLIEGKKAKELGKNTVWSDNGWEDSGEMSVDESIRKTENELTQLKEELKRVETEGFAALKPIYNFYENRVYRELEKMYSKEGITRIKDEYGNEWYEVDVVPEVDRSAIFFQLPSESQVSSKDIEDKLMSFVKALNFDVETVDNLKEVTGFDAISAVDLINKVVLYSEEAGLENIAKETAYVAYSMLGKKNKIVTDLRHSITEINNYNEIFAEYKEKSPNLTDAKINELIVIDFIADAIKNNFEIPKDSYINRQSEYWSITGSSVLEKKIKYYLNKIFQEIKKILRVSKLSNQEITDLANDIANDILTGNYQKYQTELEPTQQQVNYNDTIKKDPKAEEIIKNFQKLGIVLTGSLSLREQGSVYRTPEENIHDLDFSIPFDLVKDDIEKGTNYYEKALFNAGIVTGGVKLSNRQQLQQIYRELAVMKQIKKMYPEFKVTNTFTGDKGLLTITGKIGEHSIDLFVIDAPDSFENQGGFQNWQSIFSAKIRMGRAKDLLDFFHWKPFNRNKSGKFAEVSGLRHFTFDQSNVVTEQQGAADQELNKIIEGFIRSLGGTITYTDDIIINGEKINANAVADVIRKAIQVANGKAGIDTLPEEAAHIFIQWLPKNSALRKQLLADIRKRPEYKKVMRDYKNNPAYQNEDGTVNEEKIAIETAGQILAGAIVGRYKDSKTMNFFQKFLRWIKELLAGKDFDAYQVAAREILKGSTGKLDLGQTFTGEEYYYQRTSEYEDYVRKQLNKATPPQKTIIQKFFFDQEVKRDPETLGYKDAKGNSYAGTTSRIYGDLDLGDKYQINAEWGNQFDKMLEGILQNKLLSQIETVYIPGTSTPIASSEVMEAMYRDLSIFIGQLTADGSIALAQAVVATPFDNDPNKRVAGSIDVLLVHPNGEMTVVDLKTSAKKIKDSETTYSYSYIVPSKVGPGSALVDENNNLLSVSKKNKYGIQVNSYSKMLVLEGGTTREPFTKNYYLKTKDGVIVGYEDMGQVEHKQSESRDLVDKVVPVEYTGKKIKLGNYLETEGEENVMTEDEMAAAEEEQKQNLTDTVVNLFANTQKFRTFLEARERATNLGLFKDTIASMDDLLASIEAELNLGADYSTVYTVFLNAAKDQLTRILPYISHRDQNGDLINADSDNFPIMLGVVAEYLKTFEDLFLLREVGTPYQLKVYKQVDQLLRDVSTALTSAQSYAVDKYIMQNATNQAIKNEIKQSSWKGLVYKSGLKTLPDLTVLQKEVGSLGGNTIADLISKRITEAKEESRENKERLVAEIQAAANKLRELSVDNYDFMKATGPDGKWNGLIVTKLGPNYARLRKAAEEGNRDPVTGAYYKYRKILDVANALAEDILYNKNLWLKKQALTRFMNAETISVDPITDKPIPEDGMYHKYTDKFKAERNEYMAIEVKNGFAKWVFKDVNNLSDEMKKKLDQEYPNLPTNRAWEQERVKWRDRNYVNNPYTTLVKDMQGNITGATKEVTGDAAYFPIDKHVEARLVAGDGTKLASDKYIKLIQPTTAVEKAKAEYYNKYVEIMEALIKQLPPEAQYWFSQGNVPFLQANIMNRLSEEGADKMTILSSVMKEAIPSAYFKDRGEVERTRQLPLAFMNGAQDIAKLKFLENELATLISKKDQMSPATYENKHNAITTALDRERRKMSAQNFHPDLTDGIIAFIGMAENFIALSKAQGILDLLEKKVDLLSFTSPMGYFTKGKSTIQGVDSKTKERIKWFMDNEFYSDEKVSKTFGDWFVKKLMTGTSIVSIGANVTGMINNAFIATLNNNIESIGSDFFRRESYKKMARLYVTEFLPGYVKTVGEHTSRDKSKKYYGNKKAGSKYEAMVIEFNMIDQEYKRPGGDTWMGKMFGVLGYGGYEAGEYMVQSKVGNAIVDSTMIEGFEVDKDGNFVLDKNGEKIPAPKLSVFDAYDFDENSGTLKLRRGYSLSKKEKYDITYKIWKMNERIHANTRYKVMLERYAVGRMLLQFHKWVFPNFLQRFELPKYNEALGMDVEGRYITLWNFIKSLNELKSRSQAWDKMTPLQKNNLKKDLADAIFVISLYAMYHILRKIADGIPEDDPYIKKMVNWLSREADRGSQELSIFIPLWGTIEGWRLIKNPIAATSSIGKFVTLLTDMTNYPFQEEEERYYQRGVFSGQLKVKKDLYDIIPVLKLVNEWNRLDQQTNFFIQ